MAIPNMSNNLSNIACLFVIPCDAALCNNPARFPCYECFQAQYCSGECWEEDWVAHRPECNSELISSSWRPAWDREKRIPEFHNQSPVSLKHRHSKLWGSDQAIDILKLAQNEGPSYQENLDLLFSCCGDLRDVMMTVNGIPEDYQGNINITIMEKDINSLIRIWMILVYLFEDNMATPASDNAVHLWYSAFISESTDHWIHECLYEDVRALNEMVDERHSYRKTTNVDDEAGIWEPIKMMTRRSVGLTLNYPAWSYLEHCLSPRELPQRQAYLAQEAVVACPSRVDSREHRLLRQPPCERLCYKRFMDFGMLLPFARPRHKYYKPNTTLFDMSDDTNPRWMVDDTMSPERGWARSRFKRTYAGESTNDIFGKLYFYLRDDVIWSFHKRIRRLGISFTIEQIRPSHPVGDIPYYKKYDRILVSSMDDPTNNIPKGFIGWLGGRFLKYSNPHATLITPHKLALRPTTRFKGNKNTHDFGGAIQNFLPEPCLDRPFNLRGFTARAVVRREIEQLCSETWPSTHFAGDWDKYGIRQKLKNTIIKRWPHSLLEANLADPAILDELQDYIAEGRDPGLAYLE
ncbi:hypothetical protein F5Y13DRAFT_199651 [Hypoxylon sp. FL1857]|nr:hypothetical protein F5Y13DRAFT_199651 [Hypoxylon sp. FL1857]